MPGTVSRTAGYLRSLVTGQVRVKHHDHQHRGDDATQMIIDCNDRYAAQRHAERRNQARPRRRARRAAVRRSRRANRSAQ